MKGHSSIMSVTHNHKMKLSNVKKLLPLDENLSDLADLFKVFGDSTRMKILYSLFESELCVCAICELLNMTQSAISHQLKVLKDNRLVGCRRDGKSMVYFLADDHVRLMINYGYEHLMEEK